TPAVGTRSGALDGEQLGPVRRLGTDPLLLARRRAVLAVSGRFSRVPRRPGPVATSSGVGSGLVPRIGRAATGAVVVRAVRVVGPATGITGITRVAGVTGVLVGIGLGW